MRKYALVILNSIDKIIDRYNLDIITNPSGNGFKLNLSTISSDIEDIITKVVQQKSIIKFTINQHQNSYLKANSLASWIQKYSVAKYTMALEYDDGNIIKYCEGKVTNLGKTEMDEFKNLAQDFEFTQTTPFFVKRENLITIQVSNVGKSYPFKYPYNYGANIVENNEIDNPYILDVPLIVTINGAIGNPNISLLDENGNSYNRVRFSDLNLLKGEQLVINSAQRKIIKIFEDGTEEDYAPEVDANYDTFLRAKTGLSFLSINTEETLEGFKLTGGWRQYTL